MGQEWMVWIWLPVTVLVYLGADNLQERSGWLLLQPMLTSVLVLVVLVLLSHQTVATYHKATEPLIWVAGPLTVGMAVPLFRERQRILEAARPLLLTLIPGSLLASASAFVLAWGFHLGPMIQRAYLTRAISLPFCLPVAALVHAPQGLAAVIVGISGVIGGIAAPWLLATRVSAPACGVAMGLAAHGIGTAVALRQGARMGAYAALGMMLNGVLTSLWLPWLWRIISRH